MLFSSGGFILLFLPISLIGYQVLSRFGRYALLSWLGLTSLFFYAQWNVAFLGLLVASILLNFFLSLQIARESTSESSRSRWLTLAIVMNLLLLAYYKYLFPLLDFLNLHHVLHHAFGSVVLPLGISFFTFTQIAFLIDLRQGAAQKQSITSYTVFVTFFPHLIAGPIIHPREIMPQLASGRIGRLRADNLTLGFSWFVMGLAKKVLVADRAALVADKFYGNPDHAGTYFSWLGVIYYAIQLYFDFSGYSDMALGLARMFNIVFPINFDSPYKAPSIIEFWQRWHMTLSRYLNEYLYTPILRSVNSRRMDVGKKVTRKAQATLEGFTQMIFYPTMLTMFIAGIWHGAGGQYIIFGLLHGSYLVINHAWRVLTPKGHRFHARLPVPLSVLITFLAVVVSLVFFRATSILQADSVLASMLGLHGSSQGTSLRYLYARTLECFIYLFMVWALPNTQEIFGQLEDDMIRRPGLFSRLMWRPSILWSCSLAILFCASLVMLSAGKSFLYFQF